MYTESVDLVIQKYMQTLKDIYTKYSGREAMGGEQKYMALSEFVDLVTSTQVIDENFGVRELNVIFNLSMNPQIDEIRSERHCKMQFHEFVEAICRVAERVVVNLVGIDRSSEDAASENAGVEIKDQLDQSLETSLIQDQAKIHV
jgi:hypothetical protein